MLEYIIKNKEWLFSGLGISVLTVLFLIFRHIIEKRKQLKIVPAHPNHKSTGTINDKTQRHSPSYSQEYSAHPTPIEIAQSIKNLPPFQQNTAEENFVGIKICWELTLSLVHKRGENIVILMCESKGYSRYVGVEASINEYPQIRVINEGQRLKVFGQITDIEASGPQVKAHRLEFE